MINSIEAAMLYFLVLSIGSVIMCAAYIGLLVAWFLARRRELKNE